MRAPEDRTREGARRLERKPADEALTAFGSEFTRPPSLIVIDCSAQAGVDPLTSFAIEPRVPQAAPQAERAREPQRLVRTRRRNVGRRRATQAAGLVVLAAVASLALVVLKSPDRAAATRPAATLAQVEQRTVPPPPVPRQQELDVSRAAVITGPTQSIPQTADELPPVPKPSQPPRVQAPVPPLAARSAPREIVPPRSIIAAPVRPAAPVDEDSRRTSVSSPVATAGRDDALSASPSLPVPTAGATPPEPSVARTAEAPPATPPSAPAPAPPPSAPPAAARGGAQRAAVEAVLGQYASAFSALDASRAKAVWPTVNQKNLERAFDSLEQQEFDLGACDITVVAPRALALCDGTARYTPRVGNRKARTESRRWSFTLRQTGQEWAIESVNLR